MLNMIYNLILAADDFKYRAVISKATATLAQIKSTTTNFANACAIIADTDFVYVGGYSPNAVRKYEKENMILVSVSPNYGNQCGSICQDDLYLYAGMGGSIAKLLKTTMALVASSPTFVGNGNGRTYGYVRII
ncbi:hypothetical protein [Clostridium sp. CF012]|uniref:hypothetical protein n=1 Tax=Clostridium sp. CF012 TaxID=2843319 RepID=UPI001C0AF41B|nr:hypothetical protein [Clostridium sp. CF012]MBU3146539.1 hypothetical protein [Clostridium sp. CF012]